jgi:cytochrome P450
MQKIVNRDAYRRAHPEVLDIDRADTRYLAFGHGIHHCLGAPLARMEGQLALGSLLRRFPELRLAVPAALRWGHGDGLVLRGLSGLPVIPGPPEISYLADRGWVKGKKRQQRLFP